MSSLRPAVRKDKFRMAILLSPAINLPMQFAVIITGHL